MSTNASLACTRNYRLLYEHRKYGLPHRSGPTRMLGLASVSSGVMPPFLDGTGYKQWAALVLGVKAKYQVAVWIGTA